MDFFTVFINFMLVSVITCWWQIGMEGLPGLRVAGHYGIPKLQLQAQVHTSTGASEGNTEKGWKAAKIDDPNKIFNNSLILLHF